MFDDVTTAYAAAHKIALEADRIVVFGSFHILGDAHRAIAAQRT
jgi:folylpolyglutamate synthase/dihydropteroate synthase